MLTHGRMSENGTADDEYSSSLSDQTDETTYSDMEESMAEIMTIMTNLYEKVDEIETHVKRLETPVVDVLLDQFTDPHYLATSSFRSATFRLARPLPTMTTDTRYPYKEIVQKLRQYILQERLVANDGIIHINEPLRTLFEFQDSEDQTTFPILLQRLRHVLV